MLRTASFDETGRYRYTLARRWAPGGVVVCFVMLNPSTADAEQDDPTIRRCIAFAKEWGYAGLVVVNIFALRSTDPAQLRIASDPVGPLNDTAIKRAMTRSGSVVFAWGNHGALHGRGARVAAWRPGALCLGVTSLQQPRHPLYVSGATRPRKYRAPAALCLSG